ncbi:fasciclin domain-containing protein [Cyclobacterium xiamenense]|uniref:fasciclin domain-containing protein n=1 Tax=Cyclobacterium xiamenense TaxID=1297121 RepID=UPI0012B6E976|nr:fasciclin domain-containing protein [Cyclobacterium xiamenense]
MKRMMYASALPALAILLWVTACGSPQKETTEEETMMEVEEAAPEEAAPSIVDIAVGSPDHGTLVTALTTAELVETLSGDGPFTVFAPTDAAFAALPEGTVASLLEPENKEQLTGILTYHVVAGNVLAADLSDGQVVETLNGKTLLVSIADGTVKINGATVTAADLSGSNGVIHVIDGVLIPE